MNYRLREIFNYLNNVLLIAFLLSNFINNDTINWIINSSFLVSIIIESIIHLRNRKLNKNGQLIFIDGLLSPHYKKLQNVLFIISAVTAIYHLLSGDFIKSILSSSMNVIFPVFFALFIKDIMTIKLSSENIEFFNLLKPKILWSDIKAIRFNKNTFQIKTKRKTYVVKNVSGNNFIELQEYLINNKLNHIKLIY